MTHRYWMAALAACLISPVPALAADAHPDDAKADHIAHIEASLQPPVLVRGRPVVDHTLAEEMAAHHLPSISIAVVDHGRIVWAKAYGLADVSAGRRATTGTLYQAGSVSKPVAASGAMGLIAEHRLFLDIPINRQLTGWQLPDNAFTQGHPVTLRHLLTHTGGTTVHGFPGYAAGVPVPSVVEVLDGKPPANTPPVVVERQPGSMWNYSGGGITIAQLAMTQAAHQPFPELMRERVFAPVGMADSTYEQPLPPALGPIAATGYLRNGAAVEGRFHTYPEMAAAGLWTTPTDLAKWAVALEQAYDGSSTRLMSQASAKAMLTPGMGGWGLGVEVGGTGKDFHFDHGGDDWGYKAYLMAWPKGGRAVVAMANGDDGLIVVNELVQSVAREYGWKGLEQRVIDMVTLTPEQARAVTGRYGHGLVVITADGSNLWLSYAGSHLELIPEPGDQFIADPAGANVPVKFTRGTDGQITALSAQGQVLPRDP